VPGLTQNWGATRDPPERSFPMCTIRHFPSRVEHTTTVCERDRPPRVLLFPTTPLPHYPTTPLPHYPTTPLPHYPTTPLPHCPTTPQPTTPLPHYPTTPLPHYPTTTTSPLPPLPHSTPTTPLPLPHYTTTPPPHCPAPSFPTLTRSHTLAQSHTLAPKHTHAIHIPPCVRCRLVPCPRALAHRAHVCGFERGGGWSNTALLELHPALLCPAPRLFCRGAVGKGVVRQRVCPDAVRCERVRQ
jgi:hypothetical protein